MIPDSMFGRLKVVKMIGWLLAATLVGFACPAAATPMVNGMPVFWAHLNATISLSKQEITVVGLTSTARQIKYTWPVSTGRKGFETPTGKYRPIWADAEHRSSVYEDAPMPYAVFFVGGYAVHGTTEVKHLGKPASHGCVRLDPANAQIFYDAVNVIGLVNTTITVTN
jgi:lipoprotein-anchoring transpeptidase ErfK/SrfK